MEEYSKNIKFTCSSCSAEIVGPRDYIPDGWSTEPVLSNNWSDNLIYYNLMTIQCWCEKCSVVRKIIK